MKLIEGNWLYLVEDSASNLKLGFTANLYRRAYAYRDTGCRRSFKSIGECGRFWLLGVRPGTRDEEEHFHKLHGGECILGSEWYPFQSRAAALLLLQNWQPPPKETVWVGEAPHFALVHRKTTSDLASLLSRSRIHKRGAAIVLHECRHCHKSYGARELRNHLYSCPMRQGGKTYKRKDWPQGAFGKCSLSPDAGSFGFHQTYMHCPICDAHVCTIHRGEHNRQFHKRPGAIGLVRNPSGKRKEESK